MALYVYANSKGEKFEEFRSMEKRDDPFIDSNGELCSRVVFPGICPIVDKNAEVFERYPDYCKNTAKPGETKMVYKDGHREPFDPTKHC